MSTVSKHLLSPQEYLARERAADFRSEYYRGEMFAMAGQAGSTRLSRTIWLARSGTSSAKDRAAS
jgi:hypothetical protein